MMHTDKTHLGMMSNIDETLNFQGATPSIKEYTEIQIKDNNPGQTNLPSVFACSLKTRAFQKRKGGSREWNFINIT